MRARDVKEDRRDLLLVRGEEGAQPLRRLQRHAGRQGLGLVVDVAEQQERDVSRVGVAEGPDLADIERLTPHDLRHTAASLAISSGANVKAVQRMLGHKSAAMTLDTYADLFDDDLADVAERMNQGGLNANVARLWET